MCHLLIKVVVLVWDACKMLEEKFKTRVTFPFVIDTSESK